ncbi:MAG TPA: L-2-amino-thiazoline-4-carboxylic acid hydrolase [Desulfosporosinus sp.]|nr:L-2-amino-thiazoline-4-carboxylic acid hydrolase [Desulfosporosinus sp.]
MSETKETELDPAVQEVRKASRQFAMLYFNFCKVLEEELGHDKAKELVNKAIFSLSLDRTDQLREKAKEQGLDFTLENFNAVSDLARTGWVKELGRDHCPYGETWVQYYAKYPWFKELAPFYCDIIDTTNIENFTRTLSHKLTKNVLWGDETCEREYFASEDVAKGKFTYRPDGDDK